MRKGITAFKQALIRFLKKHYIKLFFSFCGLILLGFCSKTKCWVQVKLFWTVFFQVGDRVIGFCDYKGWSELVTIPSQFVYKMPENMSYQDGAALPMSYLTAYILLFDIANLRQGQSVFTHSVGGGVVSKLKMLIIGNQQSIIFHFCW